MNREGDSYRALQLLDEFSKGHSVTQRDLSDKFGIALGLVNSYVKNLVKKGYVKIKNIPPNKYAYYLTPKGIAEKAHLTYQLLQDYTNIYKEARKDFKGLFRRLYDEGIRRVVFAGADEVAEIAYLSLQEADITFAGVIDDKKAGEHFFKTTVLPFDRIKEFGTECFVIASFYRRMELYEKLISLGVPEEKIKSIYPLAASNKVKVIK